MTAGRGRRRQSEAQGQHYTESPCGVMEGAWADSSRDLGFKSQPASCQLCNLGYFTSPLNSQCPHLKSGSDPFQIAVKSEMKQHTLISSRQCPASQALQSLKSVSLCLFKAKLLACALDPILSALAPAPSLCSLRYPLP